MVKKKILLIILLIVLVLSAFAQARTVQRTNTNIVKISQQDLNSWQTFSNSDLEEGSFLYGNKINSRTINRRVRTVNERNINGLTKKFLSKTLKINSRDLKLVKRYCDQPFNNKQKQVCSAFYQQLYKRVPVWNSLIGATAINNNFVFVKDNYFSDIDLNIKPKVTKSEARKIVQEALGKKVKPLSRHLVILPKNIEGSLKYYLSWKVDLPLTSGPHAYTYFVDAHLGEIINVFDRISFDEGTVTGEIYPEYHLQEKVEVPFQDNSFLVNEELVTTNDYGTYNILGDVFIKAKLEGPYAKIINHDGNQAEYSGSEINWNWADFDQSYKQEESNAFYHINIIHDYFTQGDPFDINELNYQMEINVEWIKENGEKPSCNAFSYCEMSNLNDKSSYLAFYGPGDECDSTALSSDTIYHEYTHSLVCHEYTYDLQPYLGESGGINEGLADYFAVTNNDNSCYSEFGTFGEDCTRNLDNNLQYPQDYNPEPHAAGNLFSGALWDLRELLGKDLTDELVIRTIKLQPTSFSEFITAMLTIDDNNQNFNDGTPHINEICESFYDLHGLVSPVCSGYTSAPIAFISTPKDNQLVYDNQEIFEIKGTVAGSENANLQSFYLEHSIILGSINPEIIASGTEEVINEVLATLETKNLGSGTHFLKLTVTDTNGQEKVFETTFQINKGLINGWPQQKDLSFYAAPVVFDINNDGQKEIIAGDFLEGELFVWNSSGEVIENWPIKNIWNFVSPPAIADLDDDGNSEIIAGTGGIHIYTNQGEYFPGWPQTNGGYSSWGSPTVYDINNDGNLDIVSGSEDGNIYVWNKNGSLLEGWPFMTNEEDIIDLGPGGFSSSAVADIDNDGFPEVFVTLPTENAGIAYLFNHDGTLVEGWPIVIENPFGNEYSSAATALSSAALVDIDNDNDLEIFVGSPTTNGMFYAWHHDGSLVEGWPQETDHFAPLLFHSSPAIADLDGDGNIEIIVGSTGGSLYAWHSDGTLVNGFPALIGQQVYSSPVIGDIDNDFDQEILIGSSGGELYAFHHDGAEVIDFPKITTSCSISSSPTLEDIDNDGLIEVVISTTMGVYVFDLEGMYDPENIEWGQFRYDLTNTGYYSKDFGDDNPGPNEEGLYCDDTDKYNLYQKGYITFNDQYNAPYKIYDGCTTPNVLIEYSCADVSYPLFLDYNGDAVFLNSIGSTHNNLTTSVNYNCEDEGKICHLGKCINQEQVKSDLVINEISVLDNGLNFSVCNQGEMSAIGLKLTQISANGIWQGIFYNEPEGITLEVDECKTTFVDYENFNINQSGMYMAKAYVDADESIVEKNEDNNYQEKIFEIVFGQ
jgi:Zn-dependent metalloprotease